MRLPDAHLRFFCYISWGFTRTAKRKKQCFLWVKSHFYAFFSNKFWGMDKMTLLDSSWKQSLWVTFMFKSTVFVSLIYCINLQWIALHAVKRYFTGDLSVFGMYSAITEDNILFSGEKWSVCSSFFIGFSSPMGHDFGLGKNKRYSGIEDVWISEYV